MKVHTFNTPDPRSLQQLETCGEKADYGVLCADHHPGYSQPIGGAVAYRHHISPSGVGYDIGCGNKAVQTNLYADEVEIGPVMDEIVQQIGFGLGRPNPDPVDHPVLDQIANTDFAPQRKLIKQAREQLGTVGGGNHYVDLFEDEEGRLWVGVHFGSRGFGHRTATGFLALAQGKSFDDRPKQTGMDSPPVLLDTRTELGRAYIQAMQLAGEYAYAGRDTAVNKVLEILGARAEYSVHNHHNFAWREAHFGEEYWVVRKGCTPAFPKQEGFVGATMEDTSVILEGVDSKASKQGLYSTIHGAGRVMSRRKAAGKQKWVKDKDGRRRPVPVGDGVVNFKKVKARMQQKGIELRGGGADEAPEVYKSLEEVLEAHQGTVQIKHRLRPVGVAMAGS